MQVMLELFEGDPVAYFSDKKRVVKDTNYKECVLAELKKMYRC